MRVTNAFIGMNFFQTFLLRKKVVSQRRGINFLRPENQRFRKVNILSLGDEDQFNFYFVLRISKADGGSLQKVIVLPKKSILSL